MKFYIATDYQNRELIGLYQNKRDVMERFLDDDEKMSWEEFLEEWNCGDFGIEEINIKHIKGIAY